MWASAAESNYLEILWGSVWGIACEFFDIRPEAIGASALPP
jgi:hypothetical protein